jgi:HlyD family secretion protein
VKLTKSKILVIGVIVAGVAIFAAFRLRGPGPVQYYTAKVENGDIKQVVEATGTINAVITVQVGSQVSGTISRLYADFNSKVKRVR